MSDFIITSFRFLLAENSRSNVAAGGGGLIRLIRMDPGSACSDG